MPRSRTATDGSIPRRAGAADPAGEAGGDDRFRALAENATSAILLIDEESTILFANPAAERIFGWRREELEGGPLSRLIPERLRERHRQGVARHLATGERHIPWSGYELPGLARDGTEIPLEVSFGEYERDGRHFYSGIITDVRERTRAAEAGERRLSFLARASTELAASLDYEKTLQTIVRLAVPEIADWAAVDLVADDGEVRRLAVQHQDPAKIQLVHRIEERYPASPDAAHGARRVIRTGESEFVPEIRDALLEEVAEDAEHLEMLRRLGLRSLVAVPLSGDDRVLGALTLGYAESGRVYTEDDCTLVEELGRRGGIAIQNAGVVRELEETRHRLEEQAVELEERGEELRAAVHRLHLHVDQTPLGAIDCGPDSRVIAWNPAAERIFGYPAEEAIGRHIGFVVPEPERGQMEAFFGALLARNPGAERTSARHLTRDGRSIHCEWYSTALVDADGEVIGVASLVEDVTERREAEQQSERQVEQLNALRAIDLAITASLDLRVTLTVLLDQVVTQLRVDAADILTLNEFTQRLEYSAGRGFRTPAIQHGELLLGECSAGRAALDRRTVSMPNVQSSTQFTRAELLQGEEFVAHYATPLVSKGRVTGVLEVFHRSPLHPEPEWLDFLEALAGQAAIAVESAQLFEDLQQSNVELALAYDHTLEGWARALDLRDNVTEGHSRRVTEMTVRLARAFGVEDAALVDIRRGALLHDIGKMGIPDEILRKAGPLTDEEWVVMKKHPVYSFELLSPIDFLRPALDIPYAHHERWDGTGYPRGLREDEIPLPARLFAVVDVWDALRSDRSYNDAWPEEKVRDHIRSLAGTHFDPQVVEIFLSMEW